MNLDNQPEIDVGILLSDELDFELGNDFFLNNILVPAGNYKAHLKNSSVIVTLLSGKELEEDVFLISPSGEFSASFFELKNVTIGVGFHWEQKENQRFRGRLKLVNEAGKIRAINTIRLEEYLKSVISSEMSSTASPEFLKAHAVISRSWLLAQIEKNKTLARGGETYLTSLESNEEVIRWYDREDHNHFDVCADDHCQRYQGITKILNEKAINVVDETYGIVIMTDDKICDARFSKCCGGLTENFENVWEPVRHRYLTKIVDSEYSSTTCVDLRRDSEADRWIRSSPPAFCNTADKKVLMQVLPDFDQETVDFFRWSVTYNQDELSELIQQRSGIDFGSVIKLEPVLRGHSGRIIKLKIHGTRNSITVGKELEIRKWLSKSHLYSSAFVVDHLDVQNGIPNRFVISGAGWGHGVGLCQIGAAVMGEKGYSFKEILTHYFYNAELQKIY